MRSYVNEWKRGGVFGDTPAPARRAADDGGGTRYDDLGPAIPGGTLAGVRVCNPENLPRETPDKMERCRALTSFCVAPLHDAQPGDVVELPRWRARMLASAKIVAIEPDEITQRAAARMKKAERDFALEEAARIAAGPAPVLRPEGPRDAYGRLVVKPPPDPSELVRVRALKPHSLGYVAEAGKVVDVEEGAVYLATEEDAKYRLACGRVELAPKEDEKPVQEKQPAEAPAARERKS